MLAAAIKDDALSEEEVLGLVSSMLLGGTDTTSTAIGNMVWSLLTHRSQWEAVRADRSLLAKTFEESVRFKDPGRGPIRLATRDTEIRGVPIRSEEHTSELQSLMRISYAVFCLKKKNKTSN